MSQEGDTTVSLYPSSAAAPAQSPYQTMNTTPIHAGHPHAAAAAAVVEHHHSSDEERHLGGPGMGMGGGPTPISGGPSAPPASKGGGGGGGGSGPGGKSRRELPAGAVATLKAWLLSPEHFTHPYPTPQDQIMLMHKTGIDKKQLKNWFTNARRRIWKPMLKKQLEAGKLAAAGGAAAAAAGGAVAFAAPGGVAVPSQGGMAVPVPQPQGLGLPQPEISQPQQPQQEMYTNFQQAQSMTQNHQHYQQQPVDPNQQYQRQQTAAADPNQHYRQQQADPNQQQYQQQQVQFDQSAAQIQQQQPLYDQYGNQVYQDPGYQHQQQYQQQQQQTGRDQQHQPAPAPGGGMNSNPGNNFSIGSLAPMNPAGSAASFGKMVKTDSHAVLMELFARDQDLVRQAAGGAAPDGRVASAAVAGRHQDVRSLRASGPSGTLRWANGTASPSSGMGQKQHSVTFEGVPSLSSWPHFSSVSSLNNLGGLQGVKSITNLSAADLSSQGNLNKMGNLAQVKSHENMGRGDSFAFLEVFFDDKSGMAGSNNSNGQRGVKRERDDDEAIGLSLDGDDGASPGQFGSKPSGADQAASSAPSAGSGAPTPAPLPEDGPGAADNRGDDTDGGKLKRAYDDALAARGLIAVRRSCEKLTDLALPAKMQRTLSQEYIRQHNQGQPMGDFFSTNNSAYAPNSRVGGGSSGQLRQQHYDVGAAAAVGTAPPSDSGIANASVEVPSTTKCALCTSVNVDTQLRPCGHMFHGRCLKPSLQNACGPPKCPICQTSMQSAILAVPSGTAGAEGGSTAAASSGNMSAADDTGT